MATPFGFGFVPAGSADCCTCEEQDCTFGCAEYYSGDLVKFYTFTMGTLGSTETGYCDCGNGDFEGPQVLTNMYLWKQSNGVAPSALECPKFQSLCKKPKVGPNGCIDFPVPQAYAYTLFFLDPGAISTAHPTLYSCSLRLTAAIVETDEAPGFGTALGVVWQATSATPFDPFGPITLSRIDTGGEECTTYPSEVTIYGQCNDPGDSCAGTDPIVCDPIGDGDYGVLIFDGTIGGVAVRVCLTRTVGPSDAESDDAWLGITDVELGCGTKHVGILIYCAKLDEEDEEPQWLIEFTNLTDGGSETFALDSVTSTDPFSATFSDTLTGLCGSDVTVASIDACVDPTLFPCCPDLDPAILCCLPDGIPAMVIDQTIVTELEDMTGPYTVTTEVEGTLVWNGTKWVGDITWTYSGCTSPVDPVVWEDSEITCDGSGGFTLVVPFLAASYGADPVECTLPLSITVPIALVAICFGESDSVVLEFNSEPT